MSELLGSVRPFGELFAIPLRNGLNRPTAIRGMGVKMVNMGELFANTRIGNIPMEQVPFSDKESQTYLLEKGDLLFARQSLVWEGAGKCSIFLGADEPITYEGHIIRARLNRDVASPEFYYYYFNSLEGRQNVETIIQQVAAAGIRGSDLERLDVPVPPIPEQCAIARILGALDDKIELNRRMNRTLEAMAQALFKSWFVDFDPVMAKSEGRAPFGMCAETAGLFPAEFVDSEMGAIPKGWEFGSILNFADLLSGGTPKTEVAEYWNGDIPWVSAKDVSGANGIFLLSTERKITELGVQKSNAKILPAKTTIVTARGTVGAHCLLGREMAMNQTNYGLKAKNGFGDYFVFFSLSNLVEQLQQNSYGTIFDTITTRTFQESQTVIPSKLLIDLFDKKVTPLMGLILDNLEQSRTLASMRDALLPRLLSGEVRVKR